MRILRTIAFTTLLLPGCGFAASKEMQELQRDVAQLQEQVRTLQSTVDKQTASIVVLVQQALDANNKTNGAMSQLSGSVGEKLNQQIQNGLRPVAGVSTEIHNVSNDTTELRSQVGELTATMNKMMQQLNDMNNAIKVLQAPAAAPPPSNLNTPAGGPSASGAASNVPPAQASVLWSNARRDYSGGKMDLALSDFQDFIKYYPNDPMAPQAQFYIGQIHFAGNQFDVAAQDFDAVLERYPENDITAQAEFMKGKALVQSGKRDAGIKEYKAVLAKYPTSEAAKLAAAQLKALGVATGTPTAASKARRR